MRQGRGCDHFRTGRHSLAGHNYLETRGSEREGVSKKEGAQKIQPRRFCMPAEMRSGFLVSFGFARPSSHPSRQYRAQDLNHLGINAVLQDVCIGKGCYWTLP